MMLSMKEIINRVSEWVMVIIITIMILAVCWQVLSRYVLSNPSGFTEELLRYSLIWLTMIGGAYAYGKGKHIAVTFATRKLSELNRKRLSVMTDFIVVLFVAIAFVYGGFMTSQNAVGQVSAALRMPMQFLYLSLIVAGLIIIFHAISNMLQTVKDVKK